MKIFKIEIWQYHCVVDTYESNDMTEILEWYFKNWKGCYENGGCTYYVYKNNEELSFDEIYQLGFED